MVPFSRLTAIAAPLPVANVDTDMLVPARFLKTVSRQGLGAALLHAQRFDDNGMERGDFVLNQPPWRDAGILVARGNFGCGSSREHAPWALVDFGIRCVIAPSFADIFYSNCFKNGILLIKLGTEQVETLLNFLAVPERATLSVDLLAQTLQMVDGQCLTFTIEPQRRHRLINGIDDIATTLGHLTAIDDYERDSKREAPWIGPVALDLVDI